MGTQQLSGIHIVVRGVHCNIDEPTLEAVTEKAVLFILQAAGGDAEVSVSLKCAAPDRRLSSRYANLDSPVFRSELRRDIRKMLE